MNGAMEAANKNIQKISYQMTETYWDQHEKIPFSLLVYRTSTFPPPWEHYFLWPSMEEVLPVEIEIASLLNLIEKDLEEVEWACSCYDQSNFIEEKMLTALCYQKRIAQAYDKKFT